MNLEGTRTATPQTTTYSVYTNQLETVESANLTHFHVTDRYLVDRLDGFPVEV